jgi:hypothetical protein
MSATAACVAAATAAVLRESWKRREGQQRSENQRGKEARRRG